MKKTINLFILLFLSAQLMAQAPQGIPYQAVARNSSGAILANQAIRVRFSIHDSLGSGAIVYAETFTPSTTSQGLFSVNVGTGTPATGTFGSVNWGRNAKFMQVELDPAGGTSYTDMGTQQMMSVPYALYAGNVGSGSFPAANTGDMMYYNGSSWVKIPIGTEGQVLTVSSGTPQWETNIVASLLMVGQLYGGGRIAYVLQSGDPGYDPLVPHGLIVALSDQSTAIKWGCYGTSATSTAIGSGLSNTNAIVALCGSPSAAKLCADLVLNGYDDWYLPSKDELLKLAENKGWLNMNDGPYWSSSQNSTTKAYAVWFYGGLQIRDKNGSPDDIGNTELYVRAVRSF